MTRTTMGQLLVNEALPEDMRDHDRVLDKKGINELLTKLAQQHPEKYAEVSHKLSNIGRTVATEFGGYTFGLQHLKKSKVGQGYQDSIKANMRQILSNDKMTPEQRNAAIVKMVGSVQQKQINEIYDEAVKGNNPLAMQALSGSRGNKMNVASLLGSDMLYSDHRDEVLPLPVTSSYSQGLKPVEYWAATYGARRGTMATKFATQDAGFLSKQLNQVAHRLMVVGDDDDRDIPNRGLPVDTDDGDNEGSLLAKDMGPYKRNTVLTPKILKHLKGLGHDRLLVRSPLVGGSPDGGVYARDVGVRERGTLPGRGEQVGLTAAQALSEPLSQGQLSAKHSGGVAGQEKAVGGFAYINQLIQVPKKFKGGAAHSEHDGTVSNIQPAPAGGNYVWVDGHRHYVPTGVDLKVKRGDSVEAGDVLSEGFPNPSIIVQHKGVGEGKRYFVNAYRDAARGAGMKVNRRNVEILARGLINHVRLTDEFGDHVPDDVVPYSTMEHLYEPRDGHVVTAPSKALGQYLERPVLHYSIGTKIRPSVLKELQHFGVDEVTAHREPPPFQAEMIRGMYSLQHDPDWMTRMYGSGLKGSLTDAVHRGGVSDEQGTSFIPSLARATDFGRIGTVQAPEAGKQLPPEGQPLGDPRKPVETPKATPTLQIPDVKPEPPKKKGIFGLFKMSAACTAPQIGASKKIRQIALAKQTRTGKQTKQAEDKPIVNSTMKPSMGTSTGSPVSPVSGPVGHPGPAPAPHLQPPVGGMSHDINIMPPTGTTAPKSNNLQPPEPATQSAPPGQVHPARLSEDLGRSWTGQSAGTPKPGTSPDGYQPGKGIMHQNDDPRMLANFVQGGGHPDDPSSGFGGQAGAVTRFGSLLDTDAVSTLTSGDGYVRRRPSGNQESDDLIGGRPQQSQGGSPNWGHAFDAPLDPRKNMYASPTDAAQSQAQPEAQPARQGVAPNAIADAATDIPAAGAIGALATGGAMRGVGALAGGDNWLSRAGKALTGTRAVASAPGVPAVAAKAGLAGTLGKVITPVQVAAGLGDDIGNLAGGNTEGMRNRNEASVQANSELFSADKWMQNPLGQGGTLLHALNPVHNARVIGSGGVQIAQESGSALNEHVEARRQGETVDAHEAAMLRQRASNPATTPELKQQAQQRLQQIEADHGKSLLDRVATTVSPNAVTSDQKFQQQAYAKQQELKQMDVTKKRNDAIAVARPQAEAVIAKLRQGAALSPEEARLVSDGVRGTSSTGPLVQPADRDTVPYGAFHNMLYGQHKDDAALHAAVQKAQASSMPAPPAYSDTEKAQQQLNTWTDRVRPLKGEAMVAQLRKERDDMLGLAQQHKNNPEMLGDIESHIRNMGTWATGNRLGVGGGKYRYETPEENRELFDSGKYKPEELWNEFDSARRGVRTPMQKSGSALEEATDAFEKLAQYAKALRSSVGETLHV